VEPQERNRVEVSAEERDALGLPIPRVTFGFSENDKRLFRHAQRFMRQVLEAAGGTQVWEAADTAHLMGGCRMGSSAADSVTDAYGRSWELPNLWVCDGSLFPTSGGVNPSLTIMALACRLGAHLTRLRARGEL
jgi:choline dehydrogenase-like flavoprotein